MARAFVPDQRLDQPELAQRLFELFVNPVRLLENLARVVAGVPVNERIVW